jgi:hypothetical protein
MVCLRDAVEVVKPDLEKGRESWCGEEGLRMSMVTVMEVKMMGQEVVGGEEVKMMVGEGIERYLIVIMARIEEGYARSVA